MDNSINKRIDECLESSRFTETAGLIKSVSKYLLNCGDYSSLLLWNSKFPNDVLKDDFELSIIFAQSLIHTGEVHQAGRILTSFIENTVNAPGSFAFLISAYIWRSAAHRLSGNLENAISDSTKAISLLDKSEGHNDLKASAHFRLGNCLIDTGNLEDAIHQLKLALDLSTDTFDLDLIARIQNSLGAAYMRLGNITKAAIHLEYAREAWAKTSNLGALASTMNNLAYIFQRLGQLARASDILQTSLDYARSAHATRLEASILIALGVVQRDLGELEQSTETLTLALGVSRQAMEKSFVSWAKAELGDTYRRAKKYSRSVGILNEAITQAQEQNQVMEIEIFRVSLGASQFLEGDHEKGLDLLTRTSEKLESLGDQEALARCYFFLACSNFSIKEFDKTITWLNKTYQLAKKIGYHEYLVNDGQDFPLVIQLAASKQIGGNFFGKIQERIKTRKIEKRKTIAGVEIPLPFEIEVAALGTSSVRIFSKSVGDAEWRSQRAKELFIYLFCHPNQTAEQIMAALWPDQSPSKALSNFHTSLYRARRATSPSIIVMNDGHYLINKDLRIYFDVSDFIQLMEPKLPDEEDSIFYERLGQAINVYRGAFLEGLQSEWIETVRRELEEKYLRTLSILACYYRKQKQFLKAIPIIEKATRVDEFQDDLYCDLVECHIALGDRLSALRVYQRYHSKILREIGSEPSSRFLELLKR
ncbi:tetratricopeptide repeat protein [Dehalogenimonas etheniformans]|uniref:Tetratricopeptide repeat protein n=1 Tax=Dehalogenimonas etheniformans TaxID=1536648 RepID=A0A2P5P8R0_9CHLR|nr:tetratricopeptide repeat protein [Dehalogenimonas etheniformans]PPD58679.1 tetratricopeptide repeat protein [Dehalogenimonas etheniformans]QNT76551.1 tetratricopeptide repeat protein [Dehalogenimonas etheniformans]